MDEEPPGEGPAAAAESPDPAGPGSASAPVGEAPSPPAMEAPKLAAEAPRRAEAPPRPARNQRPELLEVRESVTLETSGYTLRLDPPDLARLRELPGSKGKSDRELGEEFLAGHASRLTAAVAGDVPVPVEIRVVVDPYSRQAFLAIENRIRGITSF